MMTAALVGRVGGLAVALGIGAAIGTAVAAPAAAEITIDEVRGLLRRLFLDLRGHLQEARRTEARDMLAQLLERVVLDPATSTARLHYQISGSATGTILATPRRGHKVPEPWQGVVDIREWRKAA